jgi:hypothetical protein
MRTIGQPKKVFRDRSVQHSFTVLGGSKIRITDQVNESIFLKLPILHGNMDGMGKRLTTQKIAQFFNMVGEPEIIMAAVKDVPAARRFFYYQIPVRLAGPFRFGKAMYTYP